MAEFSSELNNHLAKLQYGTRVGQSSGQPPVLQSSFDVMGLYEWLCDAVHPSFGSATTYTVMRASD